MPEDAGEVRSSKRYTAFDRIRFAVVAEVSYWLIRSICRTLRWEVDNWCVRTDFLACGQPVIFAFWHGRIFPAVYHFRNWGSVVMTSRHRDGEYIVRLIRRFGFGAARGSSTRGGRSALAEMIEALDRGRDVGFTIDGPRGPRYVAKSGAVWLAAKTGCPLIPVHISHQRKWVLSSWDAFEIPKPFSRVLVRLGAPIHVSAGATEEEMAGAQQVLQQSLDDLQHRGESHWSNKPRP
jgi:hypothetical protein